MNKVEHVDFANENHTKRLGLLIYTLDHKPNHDSQGKSKCFSQRCQQHLNYILLVELKVDGFDIS